MATLPQNWKNWVLNSLLQGSDGMQILKTLLQNGFTFEAAKKALAGNLPQGIACNKDEAFYRRVYHPGLLDNLDKHNAQFIEKDRAQLIRIDNFLSAQESEHLVKLTKSKLRPSEIPERPDGSYQGFRTSSTCDLPFTKDPAAKAIDQKTIDTLGLGFGEMEIIQAQHYSVGQQFKAHWDYFEPGTDDFKRFSKDGGQRTWTFMVYLSDGCQGGETEFVNLGVSFKPQRGTALIWNNLNIDGTPNTNTKHQAHPVTAGEKVVITKWFREDTLKRREASE